ncbi:MAG: cation-translocating P-type ATPase [Desulfobaccales bacterium]
MNLQEFSRPEVLQALASSESGLSQAEAVKRLQEYGPNEISEVKKRPLYLRFLGQFTHFLAMLLWLAAALCFISEYLRPGEGLLSLGLAIIGVIFINAVFTFIQEYRAERALVALKGLLPFNVRVIREGRRQEVPAREVVPGDVFLLEAGDKVPADGRLLEVNRLMVNNAPLTGESDPKPRSAEPFSGDYRESPNLVFAGTLAVSGSGLAVALATGMATEFGKIAHLTSAVEPTLSPLQQEIIRVTRIVAALALSLGLLFFALGFLIGRSFWHNFLFAIGIIMANVPEGLLPTVTLSLAVGSQRMAKRQALIKNLNSVETLGSITVICSDKTGTLTQNRMEVKRLWVFPEGGGRSEAPARTLLLTIAQLCNNAVEVEGGYRGDPTEVALLKAARTELGEITRGRLGEIPFDAERKRMTTITRVSGEILGFTKGALESVLPLCAEVLVGTRTLPLDKAHQDRILGAYHTLMDEGLRVMAFACRKRPASAGANQQTSPREEDWEQSLTLVGLAGLEDPPRPEVSEAVRRCQEAGIRIFMITGDAGRSAAAVARQIGLGRHEPLVIEGPALENLSDQELKERLTAKEIIFARMIPSHKMRIVSLLKEKGEKVAVTGDGVNDAPALRRADIGIAMGVIGTDVARKAADMVLLDDNFATIVNAIEEGRGVFDNIRKFVSYIFASNIPEIIPYIAFVLFRIPLPLTIMQILAVDLGTDMLPALGLGAERPSAEVMKRPPRSAKEKLLYPGLLARANLFLGPIEAAAGLSGFFLVLYGGGWQWGEMLAGSEPLYLKATTACLAGIIVTQIANVFACRSFTESVFSLGVFSNRLILVGIAAEILLGLFIVYHPWGQRIFGTGPLAPEIWLLLAPFAVGLLLAEELRKFIVRLQRKRSQGEKCGLAALSD